MPESADLELTLADAAETESVGASLARLAPGPSTIYLSGDLGAGKTCLARGLIGGLGHVGPVKSPTYALLEPYSLADVEVWHFDLYRLTDPHELETLGWRERVGDRLWMLIEWPERAAPLLPPPDLHLHLSMLSAGRRLRLQAGTETGHRTLARLTEKIL